MSIKGEEAIGYVRVSTVRQVEEGNSIQSQFEDIRNYAKSRGLIIRSKNIVIDDGTSGGIPIWERPKAQKLLKLVESGKYKHVIVTKLDRMFRLTNDAILTIEELKDAGVSLHIINMGGQSLDTSSAMGQFILTFIAAIAQLERGLIAERTKEAMNYLMSKGRKFTRSIYGWNVKKNGRLKPNWHEQSRIDFMYWQIKKNGATATMVAKMANKKGWKGKLGGEWYAQSVLNVIRNQFHSNRDRFNYPERWNERPWHRKSMRKKQKDEKIVTRPLPGIWDEEDLRN
jgi:DNA invertase Pin-like site-specific DNA recombinase